MHASRSSVSFNSPFSPTFAVNSPEMKEFLEVQEKTFRRWLNSKLEFEGYPTMNDLARDLSDGVRLIQLMEIMSQESLGKYTMNPKMRVQKMENVLKALDFIRGRGVILTNIGAEDIVDGNLKLILGMIWTLVLRFTIAEIAEGNATANHGLLLWCQRKTADYEEVDVKDFTYSWKDGLAFCALIHKHRPDLIDYDRLVKSPDHAAANTELAFRLAEEHLGIPRLLEVEDVCNVRKPDEKSIITYLAQYFHAFSTMDHNDALSRRVVKFADILQSVYTARSDYEVRARKLISAINSIRESWSQWKLSDVYSEAKKESQTLASYKKTTKRDWAREKIALAELYNNIVTKLKTYEMAPYRVPKGLSLDDIDAEWLRLIDSEAEQSRAINANLARIKDSLARKFANLANAAETEVKAISDSLASMQGELEAQLEGANKLTYKLEPLKESMKAVRAAEIECENATVESNDYTILTSEDLEFDLELLSQALSKKKAFIENSIVSRQKSNLTPAQLEEFESVFRHFDQDQTNTLNIDEFSAALSALGMVLSDEDIEEVHCARANEDGSMSFEAFIELMIVMTEDTSSPEQIRSSFAGLARNKPYITELDLRLAQVPPTNIEFLAEVMPKTSEDPYYTNQPGWNNGTGSNNNVNNYDSPSRRRSTKGDENLYDFHALLDAVYEIGL